MSGESQIKDVAVKILQNIDTDQLSNFSKDVIAQAIVAAIAEYDRQNSR